MEYILTLIVGSVIGYFTSIWRVNHQAVLELQKIYWSRNADSLLELSDKISRITATIHLELENDRTDKIIEIDDLGVLGSHLKFLKHHDLSVLLKNFEHQLGVAYILAPGSINSEDKKELDLVKRKLPELNKQIQIEIDDIIFGIIDKKASIFPKFR